MGHRASSSARKFPFNAGRYGVTPSEICLLRFILFSQQGRALHRSRSVLLFLYSTHTNNHLAQIWLNRTKENFRFKHSVYHHDHPFPGGFHVTIDFASHMSGVDILLFFRFHIESTIEALHWSVWVSYAIEVNKLLQVSKSLLGANFGLVSYTTSLVGVRKLQNFPVLKHTKASLDE